MAGELTLDELQLSSTLRGRGLQQVDAVIITAMLTRGHRRPKPELTHILRSYQGAEDPHVIDNAIERLVHRGYLLRRHVNDREVIEAAPTLLQGIQELVHGTDAVEVLARLSAPRPTNVAVLGPIDSDGVYGSFDDVLRGATTDIAWPMVATSPDLASVAILKERSRNGVRVRLLMASTRLATALRGKAIQRTSLDAIRGWHAVARDNPGIVLRLTDNPADLRFPSSTLVDLTVLRLNVHDPGHQRSLEGTMLQVTRSSGNTPNLITFFAAYFDAAWASARPVGRGAQTLWWMKSRWPWLAAAAFAIFAAAFASLGAIYVAIMTSISATFFFTALIEDGRSLLNWLRGSRRLA